MVHITRLLDPAIDGSRHRHRLAFVTRVIGFRFQHVRQIIDTDPVGRRSDSVRVFGKQIDFRSGVGGQRDGGIKLPGRVADPGQLSLLARLSAGWARRR